MKHEFPQVSAIILNFQAGRKAVECVRALKEQTIADQMEIIVVDNHSEDDSIGILRNSLRHMPNVRIVETPENLGFGRGYDTGIRQARGEFILINNPEKKLEPDAVEKMVAKMEGDQSIGIVAPKLHHEDGSVRLSARSFPRPLDVFIKRTFLHRFFPGRMRRYLSLDHSTEKERDVDWVVGGCFLIRADLYRTIGGFDHRYFLFFEDIDLCRTCWKAGKRVVYFPEARGLDRKRRLSEMNVFAMFFRKTGRAHITSALRYFWKWRKKFAS